MEGRGSRGNGENGDRLRSGRYPSGASGGEVLDAQGGEDESNDSGSSEGSDRLTHSRNTSLELTRDYDAATSRLGIAELDLLLLANALATRILESPEHYPRDLVVRAQRADEVINEHHEAKNELMEVRNKYQSYLRSLKEERDAKES